MPGYWIVKSEPSTYSYADLEREGKAVWDGIRNAQALIHLRGMKKGDRVLLYHTGAEKAVVGIARVAAAPYRDPQHADSKLAVVDLVPERALPTPVPLADIRKEPGFASLGLVRHTRLSVMPVTAEQWGRLLAMGGLG